MSDLEADLRRFRLAAPADGLRATVLARATRAAQIERRWRAVRRAAWLALFLSLILNLSLGGSRTARPDPRAVPDFPEVAEMALDEIARWRLRLALTPQRTPRNREDLP